jgi:porphobilinogen synthase
LRRTETIRQMVRETTLEVNDLIYPLFSCSGQNICQEIPSMPGIYRLSVDQLGREIDEVLSLGIPAVLIFGIPESKDPMGSGAYAENGIAQQAIREIKRIAPDLLIVADLCLCEYTSHGHCGALNERGEVLNDATLELLAKTALSQAHAGADIIAPSDMMDGRVAAIREALDTEEYTEIPILSYAVKYASAFYGPFRDAADSATQFGDRCAYQMDSANRREALREAALDIEEGADILMVKPAMAYMDIIREVREMTNLPLAAYNVSGEYAMVKAAAANGWIDEKRIVLETLTGMKRAGADILLTYHAKDVARWLRE